MKTIQRFLTSTLIISAFFVGSFNHSSALAQTSDSSRPTADAGPDQTITLPNSMVNLSGSSTGFNGFVPPTYSWSKLSGSGTINSPSSANTSVTGLTGGTSVFMLTVTDNVYTVTDTVNIYVNSIGGGGGGTGSATANAGPDQTIYYPSDSANVSGSSTGINGFVIYYSWAIVSGGGTISTPNSAYTSITGLPLGTSTFRFTATNNTGDTATDDIDINVLQSPPPLNIPPTAYAGSDQVIYTPNSTAYLVGNGTDPDGSIVSYSWSKLSGSGVINSQTGSGSSDAVTITGLTLGDSVFRLTVMDNQGDTGTDDVTIRVLSGGGTGGGCTGTGCGGGGTGGSGGGTSGGGGASYVCPVGTIGVYPNCVINTTNTNPIYFVNTLKLNIRASNSSRAARVVTVTKRTLLEVLEGDRSSLWIKVKTNTGFTGYVMTRYTQQLVKIGNHASITERLVNVRSDESLRYKPLRTLKPTDVVEVMYVSPITSWVKVKSSNGQTGFVNKYLLKVVQ